ncbi:hypothetical protein H4R18_001002 [Coemansia javaensis]|uniref:Uncharacterized protein n=1 Tax=Coemansia javaensis TaxID=2761396 RepID=A0A9W8HKZ0_9FUNG|nr:hypothetical protein H4R18_001002 [Coemansia javaensis]
MRLRLTIDCSAVGDAGCAQLQAVARMLSESKPGGPISAPKGDPGVVAAIAMTASLFAVLAIVLLALFARRQLQKRRQARASDGYQSDELDDTFVDSPRSPLSTKRPFSHEDEVVFRLSMSPY